jgi:hypothetical protein
VEKQKIKGITRELDAMAVQICILLLEFFKENDIL